MVKKQFFIRLSLWVIILVTSITAVQAYSTKQPPEANSEPLYRELRNIKLSGNSIEVKNMVIRKDAAVFTFKEGRFYFLEPVQNRVTGAVFIGDASFQMEPVRQEERDHLRHLTRTSGITETVSRLVLRFTDNTYQTITAGGSIESGPVFPDAQKILENHRKLIRKGRKYLEPNIAASLTKYNIDLRLLTSLLWTGEKAGKDFFYAFLKGNTYGELVFMVDPLGAPHVDGEEILLAALGKKNLGIWVADRCLDIYRKKRAPDALYPLVDLEHCEIEAEIMPDETLEVSVKSQFTARVDGARVIALDLFPTLRVKEVADGSGNPLIFIQEGKKKDALFAVILPEATQKGKPVTLSFTYGGKDAVEEMGSGNFSLVPAARFSWYPNAGFGDRAMYKVTLLNPSKFDMVGVGNLIERKVQGKTLVTRWETPVPVPVVGFNYGLFKKHTAKNKKLGTTIEAYANTKLPDLLRGMEMNVPQRYGTSYNFAGNLISGLDTTKMTDELCSEAMVSLEILTKIFGPQPFKRIAVTQQPYYFFGQAYPALVYMPLLAYLPASVLERFGMTKEERNFYRDLGAHEMAHQWWGHTVGWQSYRSQWLSEAFSELSASLFTQSVYKNKEFIETWRELRKMCTQKNQHGVHNVQVGSLALGYRLVTARTGNNNLQIVFRKGAFVAHMLRMLMWDPKTGDERFFTMLKDLISTYYTKNLSTDDFKRMVEKHMTPQMNLAGNGKMDWFFKQWVKGNTIPRYKLDYNITKIDKKKTPNAKGKFLLTLNITQSNVYDDFVMRVPIYLELKKHKYMRLGTVAIKGNKTAPELKITLPSKPKRVLLNAFEDILCLYDK